MAREKKNNYTSLSEGLTEREVFNRTPYEPTASDLFTVPFAAPEDSPAQMSGDHLPSAKKTGSRLTHSQTLLLAGIILVVAMLGYTFLHSPQPQSSIAQENPLEVQPSHEASDPGILVVSEIPTELAAVLADDPQEAMSLQLAESFYAQMSFESAYHVYHQLHEELVAVAGNTDMQEFLVLRLALCAKGLGQEEVHIRLLNRSTQSGSPLVRAVARYHQCLDALREGQYLNAQTWAYQALALADAISPEFIWVGTFRRQCRFVICQATTQQALALQDAEGQGPEDLWHTETLPDPFQGLNNSTLTALLAQGKDLYEKALLGPQIQMASGLNQGVLWNVVCNGASVDEFLTRFVANAHMDVNWSFDVASSQETIDPSVRRRPVHLLLTQSSSHEIVEIAAGSARLFAEVDSQGTIQVMDPDPTVCPSLSACSQQWTRQAVAVWQRLRWTTDGDEYQPKAHFALGLLREAMNRPSEAIAEYRLLADRFSRSKLAPHALMRTSRIKTRMADYLGVRDDLKLLVDQYPDVAFSDEAVLYLAQASQQAGLHDDAYRLFTKVFNQAVALDTRVEATLGAGECSFALGRFDKAARWIVTHLDLANRLGQGTSESARLLLGKTFAAMGQHDKACQVFRDVLTGQAEKPVYWEALVQYVQTRIAQDQPVAALHVLTGSHPWALGQDQENQMHILKAQVYRSMGLNGKASALLNAQLRLIPDRQQRAQAYFELGSCAMALEDYQGARRSFSEVMVLSEPGPRVTEAAYELARASLALNQVDRALGLCQQVLTSNPTTLLRGKTLQLLTDTHLRRDQFEQAAQSLLDQFPKTAPDTIEAPGGETDKPLLSKNG